MTKLAYFIIGIVAGATIAVSYANKPSMQCDAYNPNACEPILPPSSGPPIRVDANGNVYAICVKWYQAIPNK